MVALQVCPQEGVLNMSMCHEIIFLGMNEVFTKYIMWAQREYSYLIFTSQLGYFYVCGIKYPRGLLTYIYYVPYFLEHSFMCYLLTF